jgi:transposase
MAVPLLGAVAPPERLMGRLKNWRRIATRYDRLARNCLAALAK